MLNQREAIFVNVIRYEKTCIIIRRYNLAQNRLIREGMCPLDVTFTSFKADLIRDGVVIWQNIAKNGGLKMFLLGYEKVEVVDSYLCTTMS